jgi:lipoprotein-anchoring transpeptidase ErfK/SrfK
MNNKKNLIVGGVVLALLLVIIIWPKNKAAMSIPKAVSGNGGNVSDLYKQASSLSQGGDMLKAKEAYQGILRDHSDFEKIEEVQGELEHLNMKILFSNVQTPQTVIHEVGSGDTLGKLAKRYGTTVELIKAGNNLRSDTIQVGQRIRVWIGKFNVFVDKSQNVLMLRQGDEILKVYKVSTGENNSTPAGTFKITSRLVDPVWFNRGAVVPSDSPQNVLGSRWLGFDIPTYGIHGTIEPETIGQQVTAGCVRMRNQDVEELYSILPIGTEVVIVD